MNRVNTQCIVLNRINFGEADRILTVLTPDQGKVRLIAKGVRKSQSKLAGGIELFSVSFVTFIVGRGEINTLISTRLQRHWGSIVKDVNRTMFGYEMLKLTNKMTEDAAGLEYFNTLSLAFATLDNPKTEIELVKLWFYMQLLKISGHSPNLKTDDKNKTLRGKSAFNFSYEDSCFVPSATGKYNTRHVKILRLCLGQKPKILQKVQGINGVLNECLELATNIFRFSHN